MSKQVGLWIDHRACVVLTITDGIEETKKVNSNMEKHVRFSGGAQASSEEDIRDNKFAGHLNQYYTEVMASLHDADAILIFGPGEAKGELQHHLESKGLGSRIVAIEAADKMTDRQIAAKIRQRFKE
jgi:hypothetical protein